MDAELLINILYATIRTGTPLLLIALGELVCEKAGVLNLGQEGMVLMGAVVGFMVASQSEHVVTGVMMASLAGMIMALLFGILAISLMTNQVATGLALTIFGTGLSAFLGADYVGFSIEGIAALPIPVLHEIPFIGPVLFAQDPLVYVSWLLFFAVYWCFKRARLGLMLRAVGENPEAAYAIGLPVIRLRFAAVLFGGAMAGLAGGYLSLAYTPLWSEGMSAGRGWIALALVVFASWKVERLMLGAYLFGAASIMHLILQGMGFEVSPNLLAMLPYVATILVLVLLASDKLKTTLSAPQSLGQPYRPG
ncbi:MAG: ABC transporter permease [Oleiphilaceae bacterium]|nr:ABC transporter permease [Oleiphilaceae bacterium]